ncbi:MAG: hypothetical protein GY789_25800 [Hyphomicrobiales bacterium]|nr:hypothetical protein [Hyphomicrobiales bacterium]MCP4997553.1 hypothetical protein [Hyphomicrobiales bacterium]
MHSPGNAGLDIAVSAALPVWGPAEKVNENFTVDRRGASFGGWIQSRKEFSAYPQYKPGKRLTRRGLLHEMQITARSKDYTISIPACKNGTKIEPDQQRKTGRIAAQT